MIQTYAFNKKNLTLLLSVFLLWGVCVGSLSAEGNPIPNGTKGSSTPKVVGNGNISSTLGNAILRGGKSEFVPTDEITANLFKKTNSKDGAAAGFSTYLDNILRAAVGLGIVLAVVMIVWGGLLYMTKGTVVAAEAAKAKNRILLSFAGIALLLSSYVLLVYINPALVQLNVGLSVKDTISPKEGTPKVSVEAHPSNQIKS